MALPKKNYTKNQRATINFSLNEVPLLHFNYALACNSDTTRDEALSKKVVARFNSVY